MNQTKDDDRNRAQAPDAYDRQLGALHDLPDVIKTSPATVRTVPPLGIGGTQVFVVQTYRQRERGDYIFVEVMGQDGAIRLVFPPPVSKLFARQRDALTTKSRRKSAQATAEDRKARGLRPAFLKAKTAEGGQPG